MSFYVVIIDIVAYGASGAEVDPLCTTDLYTYPPINTYSVYLTNRYTVFKIIGVHVLSRDGVQNLGVELFTDV